MTATAERVSRLPARDLPGFTALVALTAIFMDAAVGHGLTWENDPYWTYWVTKTFLIAAVFGLGTAWFGVGAGRGAVITAVHTIVLTVYYWTFAPIGLPSQPEWLDLEHTWITGLPIHFGVIYLGYLTSLWAWRRRDAVAEDERPAILGTRALVVSAIVVILAGGIASLALGEFPGVQWFLVRLLLTVTFLLIWWPLAGRDRTAGVVGAVILALAWAAYAHFVGPQGLPDTPLRILDPSPPPATAEWLGYRELWIVSFPIYFAVMLITLLGSAAPGGQSRRRPLAAAALVGTVLLITGFAVQTQERPEGVEATLAASGPARIERGPMFGGAFEAANGDIAVQAIDVGGRVTPLPPHDRLRVEASIDAGGTAFSIRVGQAMIEDPLGRHTTWWGVGTDVEHHGVSGIGTGRIPAVTSDLAAFGLGDVSVDGEVVATGVPVHVMTMDKGGVAGARLELDVGEETSSIPGLPDGHLRVLWPGYSGEVPKGTGYARYAGGGFVLLLLLVGALYLNRREARTA